jgi:hypothetical protein
MEPKEIDKSIWIERFKNVPKDKIDQIEVKPEEAYIITSLETNAANSRGWAIYYGKDFEEQINVKGELLKIKETVPVIFSMPDGEEKNKKIAELKNKLRIESDAELDEKKLIDSIGKQIKQVEHGINYGRESSASQWAQAEEMRETIKHVQSAESYALKESHRAYALAGMSAYQKTKQLEQQGKLEKPIYIAMENLFPESYGSHTDELISLVQNSRAQMTEMLKQKNMSESEAKKAAAEHIGATFDTGHFNMWKKYWRGDENKTVQQNEEAFKKWFLDQVEKLAKSGVVKHLHIVDNYGYQDEHLAPGQGNTPVKEAIEIFKKYGFKGNMIVEPGSATAVESSQFGGMTNTWKYLGASTYGSHGVASQRWGSIGNAYAGQMQPPYFVVGAYSPSEEWTLWSGTPLE